MAKKKVVKTAPAQPAIPSKWMALDGETSIMKVKPQGVLVRVSSDKGEAIVFIDKKFVAL